MSPKSAEQVRVCKLRQESELRSWGRLLPDTQPLLSRPSTHGMASRMMEVMPVKSVEVAGSHTYKTASQLHAYVSVCLNSWV